ncbi:MAG: hypothetical protein PHW62_01560 [Candidatus Ratteibacteria bacterium]|nr:hypothetical protein [Candidatus Ratteibacteria bacterium]
MKKRTYRTVNRSKNSVTLTRQKNKKKVKKEQKLDIHGSPVGDYRGKHWDKKLKRFVYT